MLLALIILYVVTLLYLSIVERFRHYAALVGLQGWLLLGVALFRLHAIDWPELIFILAETLVFKAIIVPVLLTNIIRRTGIDRVHVASVATFNQLLLSLLALLCSIVITYCLADTQIDRVFFGVALYGLLSGMLLIVNHKRIFSHLVGFLVIENGVFLFSMAIGVEMPYLINIAILLDILMSVLMLGMFVGKIGQRLHDFNSDSLLLVKTLHFPLWNKQRKIPKAYTRLIQYNDSLFIGTSFMPKEISVELMNLNTEKVVNSINFPLKPKEEEYSGPYECKIATEMNFIVAAYRYINRLEIYKLSDQKIQLNTIIGDANNQYDLYRLNKDSEMIFHYSDIVCGKNQIYALYQGVKERELSSANSKIEVYAYDGTHLRTFDLGRNIEKILVDESSMRIYAFDKNEEEDIMFCYAIESNT